MWTREGVGRLTTRWHHHLWILETHMEDLADFDERIRGLSDNRPSPTATNGGTQHYFGPEIGDLADRVRSRAQWALDEFGGNALLGDLDRSWTVTYEPGGWQALHNHARGGTICTVTLNLDTNPSEDTSRGALHAVLPDTDGSTHLVTMPYWRGKLTLMEGSIYHGAYPTEAARRILVFDYAYSLR